MTSIFFLLDFTLHPLCMKAEFIITGVIVNQYNQTLSQFNHQKFFEEVFYILSMAQRVMYCKLKNKQSVNRNTDNYSVVSSAIGQIIATKGFCTNVAKSPLSFSELNDVVVECIKNSIIALQSVKNTLDTCFSGDEVLTNQHIGELALKVPLLIDAMADKYVDYWLGAKKITFNTSEFDSVSKANTIGFDPDQQTSDLQDQSSLSISNGVKLTGSLQLGPDWNIIPSKLTEEMKAAAIAAPIPAVYLDSISARHALIFEAQFTAAISAAPKYEIKV